MFFQYLTLGEKSSVRYVAYQNEEDEWGIMVYGWARLRP